MNRTETISYFVFFVINLVFTFAEVQLVPGNTTAFREISKNKWVSQLFREAETIFEFNPNVDNADCRRDFLLYKSHLQNQTIWAVKMMESSEWPSIGLFSGRLDHLGDYDECLSISSYGVKGQYCLAQVVYDNLDENAYNGENAVEYPDQKVSVWKALALYRTNPVRADRRRLRFALCIPSSCRPNDLKVSLNKVLTPIFLEQRLNISVDVNPTLCKTSQQYEYPPEYYVVRWMFILIFFIIVLSTCFYKNATKTSLSSEILKSFSIVENFRTLKSVNSETNTVINFTKFIFMNLGIIHVHRRFANFSFPNFNAEIFEQSWKWTRFLLPHITAVDVFFAITGFLTFHCDHLAMKKDGLMFLFISLVSRWIRMVPVFGLLMLYIVYVLPYTGEGPLWNDKISNEVSRCEQSWWASLLAINNIVKTDQQCLIVSWYISVDMQLAVIGAILLYIYSRNERLAVLACIVLIIGAMVVTFLVVYANEYHGTMLIYSTTKDPRDDKEFANFYVSLYPRIVPYLMGFLCAIVTKILNEKNYKFSALQRWLLFFFTLVLSEGSIVYASQFYIFGRGYNRVEHAAFASLNHFLFILMYAVLCCMHFVSGLGIFSKFVEWKGFAPLGRLTYSVFLLNTIIQLYHTASQRRPLPTEEMNLMWIICGDIIMCYTIGLVLHILVEAPIANISRIMKKQILKYFHSAFQKTKTNHKCDKLSNHSERVCDEKYIQKDECNFSSTIAKT